METTVTLDWDPPQGRGSEAVVDNYAIFISPPPTHYHLGIVVARPQRNVTLQHNRVYSISITAINCVGESNPSELSNIEFGMYESS